MDESGVEMFGDYSGTLKPRDLNQQIINHGG